MSVIKQQLKNGLSVAWEHLIKYGMASSFCFNKLNDTPGSHLQKAPHYSDINQRLKHVIF